MNSFEHYFRGAEATWPDMTVLGNFVNNHDNPRFLHASDSQEAFKSALIFTLSTVGIPMVYYGDEQAYGGGMDPANREPLWTNMDSDTDIYRKIKTINNFRKSSEFYKYDQVQRYSDDEVYAFSRGDYFFAFTNSRDSQARTINYHSYPDGTVLCNIFHRDDCVEVENGEFPLVLINGESKVFASRVGENKGNAGVKKVSDLIRLGVRRAAFSASSL
jgi:alpha-amylase